MNWIKQNLFLSILLGSTLALSGVLAFIAIKGGSKYQKDKENFETAYEAVNKAEKLELYPLAENRDAKVKALDDYQKSIDELRAFYKKYQIDASVQLTTQQFTQQVIAANEDVEKAFKEADSKLPADFFMGFEAYRGQLAKSGSTVLLDYQLKAIRHLLLDMAKARPSELIHIYREKITEENDGKYSPGKDEVVRKFSFEIAFKGSEASVRDFMTKLGDKNSYCYVIRSIRINNERNEPPRISDAKFENPAAAAAADPATPFGGDFVLVDPVDPEIAPPQPEAVVPDGNLPPAPVAPPAVVPPLPTLDTSRILAQVLGDEELQVFVRFDILLFSPTEDLIKP